MPHARAEAAGAHGAGRARADDAGLDVARQALLPRILLPPKSQTGAEGVAGGEQADGTAPPHVTCVASGGSGVASAGSCADALGDAAALPETSQTPNETMKPCNEGRPRAPHLPATLSLVDSGVDHEVAPPRVMPCISLRMEPSCVCPL